MADRKPLKCSTCGTLAVGDLAIVARPGGTHYTRKDHGVGIPGNRGNRIARTCGTWAEQEAADAL